MTDKRPAERMGGSTVDFVTLVLSMRESALALLGIAEDPDEGRAPEPDVAGARFQIDMIAVIEEKSRGNLSQEEERLVRSILHELRVAWLSADGRG